jgi:hypothetical protein
MRGNAPEGKTERKCEDPRGTGAGGDASTGKGSWASTTINRGASVLRNREDSAGKTERMEHPKEGSVISTVNTNMHAIIQTPEVVQWCSGGKHGMRRNSVMTARGGPVGFI